MEVMRRMFQFRKDRVLERIAAKVASRFKVSRVAARADIERSMEDAHEHLSRCFPFTATAQPTTL